jgi:hypothetical protein
MNKERFDFISSRLTFIEITKDEFININLWHHLDVFETHVYGIFSQYSRIKENLKFKTEDDISKTPTVQVNLDIYYYILTWDKLKKIYEKIKNLINQAQQSPQSLPEKFTNEFRNWKRRIDHIFTEYDDEIRNEYEHPSLDFYSEGALQMWGNIMLNADGNIKAHAGKDSFAVIKKQHVDKVLQLRTDLFDLFLKYFTQKPLNQELIKVRDSIETNVESIIQELTDYKSKNDLDNFNNLIQQLISVDIALSREYIRLSDEVKNKIYSMIFQRN